MNHIEILATQAEDPEMIFRLRPKADTDLSKLGIDAESGVVARIVNHDPSSPYASIYYEGNRYDATNLRTLAEREQCAAGRLHASYPTVARTSLPLHEASRLFDFEIPEVSLVPKIAEKPYRRHRYPHDERGWQPT